MGKGRNRNKDKDSYSGPNTRAGRDDSDSDESVSTHLTFDDDMRSVRGDDIEDVDTILDKLEEHIDNSGNKNISIRMAALRHLQLGFTSEYVPDFILKWKATLLDLVVKNLKKTDEECIVASILLALISIQVGEEIGDLVEEPFSIMRPIVMDSAKPESLRAMCSLSLAISSHLSCEDDASVADSLKALRHAWSSFKLGATSSRLFCASLQGWALLLQSAGHAALSSALGDYAKLSSYLEANQLESRTTCGEVIAFVYEFARDSIPNYRFPNHAQVVDILDGFSLDNTKGKGKKDKRVQRFTFRQIHACIVDNEPPAVTIKFNRQSLLLDTCTDKLFYDVCCEILHGGMMNHLEQNEQLRDIFDLGPIPETSQKVDKLTRLAYHDATTKYRNQQRGKQRDKRAAVY